MADHMYLTPSIPRFYGHYDHWALLMENLLRSKDYWKVVELGIPISPQNATPEKLKAIGEGKLKDFKAKNYLFQAIERGIIETKVKRALLQALRKEYKMLHMKDSEGIADFFPRTLGVVNIMKVQGKNMSQHSVVEKILQSMSTKWEYVIAAIEESNDVTTMTLETLQSKLLVHESRMKGHETHKEEEQALKVTVGERFGARGRGRGRGRGRQSLNKDQNECYKCGKLGHYRNECPSWEEEGAANYIEFDEEETILLMAIKEDEKNGSSREELWFLDSRCSNHMCGNKAWFTDLDEKFAESVKLGNGTRMLVKGKGTVKLKIVGILQIVRDVYYVPDLKNNLISIGQLQERGLKVVFENNKCKVFHREKGLIITSLMTKNKMFIITGHVISLALCTEICYKIEDSNLSH